MAVSRSLVTPAVRVAASGGTTALFTPGNGCWLEVVCCGTTTGGTSPNIVVTNSLALTQSLALSSINNGGSFATQIYSILIFVATGASMTVSATSSSDPLARFQMYVYQIDGAPTSSPIGGKVATTVSGLTVDNPGSITLDATPSSTSLMTAFTGSTTSNATPGRPVPGSGWAEDFDVPYDDFHSFEGMSRTGLTSTTVTWAKFWTATEDAPFGAPAAIAREWLEAGGGGGSTVTKDVIESSVITDSSPRSFMRSRLQTDASISSDGTIRKKISYRFSSEAILAFDNEGTLKTYLINFDDATDVVDDSAKFYRRNRFTTDAAVISDSIIKVRQWNRLTTDAIAAVDSIIKSITGSGALNTKVVSESLVITDEMVRIRRTVRMVGETMTLIDSLIKAVAGAGFTYVTVISESVTIQDEAGRRSLLTRQFLESVLMSDQNLRYVERPRVTTEGITLTDGFLSSLRRVRDMFESVTISDGVAKIRWSRKFVDELLGITDDRIAYYIPFLQYTYDVRIRIGVDNFILLGHDDVITLGGYQ